MESPPKRMPSGRLSGLRFYTTGLWDVLETASNRVVWTLGILFFILGGVRFEPWVGVTGVLVYVLSTMLIAGWKLNQDVSAHNEQLTEVLAARPSAHITVRLIKTDDTWVPAFALAVTNNGPIVGTFRAAMRITGANRFKTTPQAFTLIWLRLGSKSSELAPGHEDIVIIGRSIIDTSATPSDKKSLFRLQLTGDPRWTTSGQPGWFQPEDSAELEGVAKMEEPWAELEVTFSSTPPLANTNTVTKRYRLTSCFWTDLDEPTNQEGLYELDDQENPTGLPDVD
jgi:hypothetical protein